MTYRLRGIELTLRRVLIGWTFAIMVLACAVPGQAHPLGNFTVNHLVKINVHSRVVDVRYVLDMAEIPTFQVMRSRNTSGRLDSTQLRDWARDEVGQIESSLYVAAGQKTLLLSPESPTATLRSGAGGLPTIYLTENFRGVLPPGAGRLTVADRTFPGRIGWKDIVVAPATEPTDELRHYPSALVGSPRSLTAVDISVLPGGLRVTPLAVEPGADSVRQKVSQVRSNALSDMLARGTRNPWLVALTLFAAIGLGALHAAEPGHGKTLLAISLVGARATPKQAVLLAIGLTLAHTAGVLLMGALLLLAARWVVPESIYPWITLLSGVAVTVLGATALTRFVRARRGRAHEHGSASKHGHDHPHAISNDAPLSFRGVMLVAMSGNIAPCPAALVVLLAALALHEVGYGLAVIVAFSIGLACVLTGLGIALVRGAAWISSRPAFDRLAAYGPLASACVISVIGAVMLGQAAAAGAFHAPPALVVLLVLTAIALTAFSPGHGHSPEYSHVHALDRGAAR
jgi:nickel/cobalt transporter (NicO) family protein